MKVLGEGGTILDTYKLRVSCIAPLPLSNSY